MTKAKTNPLQAGLDSLSQAAASPAPVKAASSAPTKARKPRSRPDRAEKALIGGHFPRAWKQQLRMIAAEEDTTSQALLEEALNLLFVKKGKGRMI